MSSSLFDCGGSWESFPPTYSYKGDKTFGELQKGDKVYRYNGLEMIEYEVAKELHKHNGHLYLTLKGDLNNINFGPTDCINVLDAEKNSLVNYSGWYIGTNKKRVLEVLINDIRKELKTIERKQKIYGAELERLLGIYNEKSL